MVYGVDRYNIWRQSVRDFFHPVFIPIRRPRASRAHPQGPRPGDQA